MAPTLSISSQSLANKVRITPVRTDDFGLKLLSVTAMVNDNTSSNPFSEIELLFLDEENSTTTTSVYLPYYDLTVPQISLGKKTFIQLKNVYTNGEIAISPAIVVTLLNVPITPVLRLYSNVRPDDNFFSIKIDDTYTLNSISDGYSRINKIIVYTSKIGGTVTTDFRRDEITVESADLYTKWYDVGKIGSQLANDTHYEVAVKYVNGMGESPLSNTILVTPKNTPDVISYINAMPLLSYRALKLTPGIDSRGDTVLRWSKPADYIYLINNGIGITKYHIHKQLMVKLAVDTDGDGIPDKDQYGNTIYGNSYVASGSPSVITLNVPNSQPGGSVVEPTYANLDDVYTYKYIIEGSSAEHGKAYQYWVVAENSNGMGPSSDKTGNTFIFASPESQPFNLLHSNTTSSLTGAPITNYDGKMSIEVTSPSNINGAKDFIEERIVDNTPVRDYKMRLRITKVENPSLAEFDNDVTLKQQTEINAYGVTIALNKWDLSFDDINAQDDGTFNTYLSQNFGTKFNFTLIRKSADPGSSYSFESSNNTSIARTAFKSPEKVSKIQLFAFFDNLNPATTSSGNYALRLVFNQLTSSEMNGLANFTGTKKYLPHKDSYPILGAEIIHDQGNTSEIEYLVDMEAEGIGVNGNIYLRLKIFNDELEKYIDGAESSPVKVGKALTYPSAVTGLNVRNDGNTKKLIISWTNQSPQSVISMGGFNSNEITNHILVYEDGNTNAVYENTFDLSTQLPITTDSLTHGKTYKVYVIAEAKYTRANLSGVNRFDNAIISKNFAKTSIVATGTPSFPIIEGTFPSDKKFTVLYDAPANLYGIPANVLEYQFFMNQESTSFPYFSTGVLQHPVAISSLTSSTAITKTFATKALSNNINNLINMVNDTPHYFAMLAKALVGGGNLITTTDPFTYPSTLVNNVNVTKTLNLVSDSTSQQSTVFSELTDMTAIYPGDNVPTPNGLELTGSQSKVTVSFIKNGSPVTDVNITVDNNDSLNNSNLPILLFNTNNISYTKDGNNYSGIFALEQAYVEGVLVSAKTGEALYPYGPSGFNFRRQVSGTITRYLIDFTNLTNGVLYNFDVRNAKKVNNVLIYSEVASAQAAPEAPPSIVNNANFSVDSGVINVSWLPVLNSGGAGVSGNSVLSYKIQLLNTSGNVIDTKITSSSVLSTQFTGLTNWTSGNPVTYTVRILAYYNKFNGQLVEGDYVSPFPFNNINQKVQLTSSESPIQIRVNTPPVNATGAFVAGDKKITGSITRPSFTNQDLYPLTKYHILIKSNVGTIVPENVKQEITDTTYNTSTTITDITGLANGKPYTVIIRANPTYTWAQGPVDVSYIVSPFGPFTITSVTAVSNTNGKNWKVEFNANGSGNVNAVIGLAKSTSSNSIVVKNLSSSSSNLPAITMSGTETNELASFQLGLFILLFTEMSSPVNDLLVAISSQYGSDSYVYPPSNSFFA